MNESKLKLFFLRSVKYIVYFWVCRRISEISLCVVWDEKGWKSLAQTNPCSSRVPKGLCSCYHYTKGCGCPFPIFSKCLAPRRCIMRVYWIEQMIFPVICTYYICYLSGWLLSTRDRGNNPSNKLILKSLVYQEWETSISYWYVNLKDSPKT